MRLRVSGTSGRQYSRFAAILAATTFLAGCSSGVTRFSEGIFTDDIFTGSTSNQRAIIRDQVNQPYPGDAQPVATAAPVSMSRSAVEPVTTGNVERGSLPSDPNRPAPEVTGGVGSYNQVWFEQGALVADANQRHRIAPFPCQPVDATGAGDAFGGAFVTRRLAGDSLLDAGRYAAAVAALSTQGYGAVAPIPRANEVRARLAG